jgi:hypothetical protein
MAKPTLKVQDHTKKLKDMLKAFKARVVIGIPDDSARSDSEVNNAALLAIHNFGSPANNIPARPVMDIGMRNAKGDIVKELTRGAKKALDLKGAAHDEAVEQSLERSGIIGATAVKKAIVDQTGIRPLKPETIQARKRKGFSGTKALLETAQMMNAITSEVRKAK